MPEQRNLLLERAGAEGHPLQPPSLQVIELLQVELLGGKPGFQRAVIHGVEVNQMVNRRPEAHFPEARNLCRRSAEPGAPYQVADAGPFAGQR